MCFDCLLQGRSKWDANTQLVKNWFLFNSWEQSEISLQFLHLRNKEPQFSILGENRKNKDYNNLFFWSIANFNYAIVKEKK